MGLREDRNFLKERKAERETLAETAREKALSDYNNRIIDAENIRAAHEAKIDKFYEYKDNVKKTLVTEALMNIYKGSIYAITDRESAICEALLGNYINEVGTSKLLKNMKFSESALLRTIQEKTEEYFKDITDGANAEVPESQTIDPEAIKKFWDDIDKSEDIDDITSLIRMRVSNAEEEFVNKNQDDKNDVKTLLKQTADRVQMAKNTNDNDYSDMVEESETRLAKQRIYQIQHEGRYNVFDKMVRNISEAVILDDNAKKEFTLESGRLDMEKIVESARCMYTLLEMVSTIQLEKVDPKYIEETLKSIK